MSDETGATGAMDEARRQLRICNACRYCEGYCAAFKALVRHRDFANRDIGHLANLCHDCRGCYYSCQYAPPHEFALNLPRALATVRRQSWERHARPRLLARALQRSWAATAGALVAACVFILIAMRWAAPQGGEGFYAAMAHTTMVAIFAPAFLLPLASLGWAVRNWWHEVGGQPIRWRHLRAAFLDALLLRNLGGGHGAGCNFERHERFSLARRRAHHLILFGFLACFAATAAGTVLHYGFARPAPYPLWSLPKLFGLPGGVALLAGCAWMLALRARADPEPADSAARGASLAFVLLLGLVAATGLVLFALAGSALMPGLLALHLGTVLALFITVPFTKMAHAPFRVAALLRDAQLREADAASRG